MAVYYRWRRRSVTITEKQSGSYSEITPDSNSTTLYYSNYIDLKSDYPNVSLVSPQRTTLKDGTLEQCGTWRNYMYFLNGASSGPCVYYGQGDGVYWNSRNSRFDLINGSSSADNLMIVTSSISYGNDVSYVYSTNSSAYPNGGVSGNYYYDQRTSVSGPFAPGGPTYPNPITTPTVTVSWKAAGTDVPVYPVNLYELSYSINNGSSWTVAGTTTGLSLEASIPIGSTSIQFRVRARNSDNQWSSYSTGTASQVFLAPTLTVPQMVMQGQQATISWTAIDGADSYTVQRKANTDAAWTQVYSGADTTFTETVGTWTSLQYRVQAVFGETAGGWATSGDIQIVSASALVISGTDGDLGTLVNDVQYTINTDTGNQITAKVTVNSAVVFSGNVTSGAASTISIFDLVNGTGTIVIEASVQASSGVVNATRTWTYTKAELTFPDTGSIAQLHQKGKNIFPKTLAECIRTSDIWGGDLSSALQKLVNAVICDPETGSLGSMSGSSPTIPMFEFGSYRGTGSYSSAHMNTLTFSFKPLVLFVFPELPYNSDGGFDAWWFIALNGMTLSQSAHYARGEPDTYFVNLTWNDNSVSWYSNGNAKDQLNSTETYYYAAIGLPGGDE